MLRRVMYALISLPIRAVALVSSHRTPPVGAQSANTFVPVDIGAVANHSLDWLNNPPSGSTTLGGVPFTIRSGDHAIFMTAQRFLENLPTEGTVRLAAAAPAASVRILLTGGYVLQDFRNRQVGQVVLSFSDGSQQTTPIIAWQNIREDWCYERDIAGSCIMSSPGGNFRFQNVFTESQSRGGASARAFLDMVTIPVPTTTALLTSITVRDTSSSSVGSVDPSLQVAGITVEVLSTTPFVPGGGRPSGPPPVIPPPSATLSLDFTPSSGQVEVGADVAVHAKASNPVFNTIRVQLGCGTPDRYEIGAPEASFTWHTGGCAGGTKLHITADARPGSDSNWDRETSTAADYVLNPPPARCSEQTVSGGSEVSTRTYEMGATQGTFKLAYDMKPIPDKIEVFYQSGLIYTSGGFVSGAHEVQATFGPGSSTQVVVRVTGNSDTNTEWSYTAHCPSAPISVCPAKELVLLNGINTTSDDRFFDYILSSIGSLYDRTVLYSYRPDGVSYRQSDTFQALFRSDSALEQLMSHERQQCPNTNFDLIGHSLGGVVVLDYLFYTLESAHQDEGAHILHAITLDSPVNGRSSDEWASVANLLLYPALRAIAGSQAAADLDVRHDGVTASLNASLVQRLQGRTAVYTIASDDDLLVPRVDALIPGADIDMGHLGGGTFVIDPSCFPGLPWSSLLLCVGHGQVLQDHDVISTIYAIVTDQYSRNSTTTTASAATIFSGYSGAESSVDSLQVP